MPESKDDFIEGEVSQKTADPSLDPSTTSIG